MPLLSIGRNPFLLDCKISPYDSAPCESYRLRCHAPQCGSLKHGAQVSFRRFACRRRKKFSGRTPKWTPVWKSCVRQIHVSALGLFFARNRMTALQVSPGTPASRSSCVGQRGAHPYTETSRIPQPIQHLPKKNGGKSAPEPSRDRLRADWTQTAFGRPIPFLLFRRGSAAIRRKRADFRRFSRLVMPRLACGHEGGAVPCPAPSFSGSARSPR